MSKVLLGFNFESLQYIPSYQDVTTQYFIGQRHNTFRPICFNDYIHPSRRSFPRLVNRDPIFLLLLLLLLIIIIITTNTTTTTTTTLVTTMLHKSSAEYSRLSEERNTVRKNAQQILVVCTFWSPP